MVSLLYSIYALTVLVVAVGGLLWVVFGTPDVDESDDYRYEVLAIGAALFIVALIGTFLVGG